MRELKISYGRSRFDTAWRNGTTTWEDFTKRVSATLYTPETLDEFCALKRGEQDQVKDVGGFVAGHLAHGRRRRGNVLARSMITLDLDTPPADAWHHIQTALPGVACAVYSTHKHRSEAPRLRLVIPLSRDVSAEEYVPVARMVAKQVGIDWCDDSTYDPERLMYWPSTSTAAEFFHAAQDGSWLDPDQVLGSYDDWRDATTWPTSSRQSVAKPYTGRKLADPRSKHGLVGVFCRTYPISDAISTFLPEIYEPTGQDNRFTYRAGESTGGLVVFDGLFAYSFHGTDPAGGQALNAFDLVRVHLYGHLDTEAKADTPVNRLPSYGAMSEHAAGDEQVRLVIAREKQAQAEADFTPAATSDGELEGDGWMAGLEYEKRSATLKNNLHNLTLILQHDPALAGIVFNQQADSMEITGEVPWQHPSRFWRDQDDAQLVCYIDAHYGTFSQRNYDIAVTKVADDRSYHPIRNYLDALPEWDGIARVDTLLVDYLGAEDSPYTRAVTRKTLCAAVRRVWEPGCKFDSMLVLNGPQGIGKSTLIARLAGQWFSDSLNLSDTKDKTAAEKLQGYWILEIGELAGLRKTEVETLRSFLSRQNDIYRAAFGRRATPHPRQCVFFGTTNAESGYLRDTTGNRRFWPVITPGGGLKRSWDITQTEIDQIWAETLVHVRDGEPLFLEAHLEQAALDRQHQAMETDEREGLIDTYLNTLLPQDWDDMDLYARRNYLDGASEFGPVTQDGTMRRMVVSNMEIWCECLGKNRADLTPMDSSRIRSVLIKLGWQRHASKKRLPLYGPQWVYTRQPDPLDVFQQPDPSGGTADPGTGSPSYRSAIAHRGMPVVELVETPI